MSSLYVPLLIFCLLLGIRAGHSLSDLGNDRKLLKRGRGCRKPDEYLCDCERVPATLYREAKTVFQREKLDCEPICEGEVAVDCASACESVICVAKFRDYCAVKLDRTQVDSIRLMDCAFSPSFQMHVCTREEYRMEVDNPTFIAVTKGSCVPACGVEVEGLTCHFNARLFGDPFILEDVEAPFDPPEIPPPSSVMEEEDEIPVEPPSAAYSYEDYHSVGEPGLEDVYTPISAPEYEFEIYGIPEPSLEEEYNIPEPSLEEEYSIPEPSLDEEYSIPEPSLEEEYSIPEPSFDEEYSIPEPSLDEEYSIPEPSPEDDYIFEELPFEYEHSIPGPSLEYELDVVDSIDKAPMVLEDEFLSVDIISLPTRRPTIRNEVYYGSWSNCTQHCAQARNGTRERSVICRNLFGVLLPPSECRAPINVNLVEACPTVNCVGDYYYLLSDWSSCSQTCSTFIAETTSMSLGTRRRTMHCFHENGTETEVANCAQQVGNLDFLVDTCGEMPCSPVRYRVSQWTECSCQTNTRNRTVECVDNRTGPVLDVMCKALEIQVPSETQTCIPTGC